MFKDTLKSAFKELITNRYLTVLSGAVVVLALGLVAYIILLVHPHDIEQVTHGTIYGVTHLYLDQWWYLFSFALFAVIVAIIHVGVAIKLYVTKGHPLALFFAWLGIGIILFAWVVAARLINILSAV